ncbi:MAG: hypothetical protein AAF587_14860 [Bacteroidota bacterium]
MLTPCAPKATPSQEEAFREQLLEALHLKESEKEKRIRQERSWQKLKRRILAEPG